MRYRVLELVDQIRRAQSEGRSWEVVEIAGRKAVRIRQDDGLSTRFLDDAEARALERALDEGPPTLVVSGLPRCTWDCRIRKFTCKVDDVDVVLDAALAEVDRDPVALASAIALCGDILDRRAELTHAAAVRLLDIAETWGAPTRAEALAARLTLASISLSGDAEYANEATLYFRDGGAFAGHHVEARVDGSGAMTHASLIG